jgi:NitT/TauT family transport system substrate-binding protein
VRRWDRAGITLLLAFAAAALAAPAAAGEVEGEPAPIAVSLQPAVYWATPFYVARVKGWWAEAGLKPAFANYPAGVPQIAALSDKAWDVGAIGAPPSVLGAARFDLLTIAVTNDGGAANGVMARANEAEAILKDPASLKGKQLLVSTNSTGEYAALACLAKWRLKRSDMQVVNLGQAQIVSAFTSGTGALAGLWAPSSTLLAERGEARMICSGKDAGVVVPGSLVARKDYAAEHPDRVARFLAVYLRAIAWQRAHRDETIDLMHAFYRDSGVVLGDKSLGAEIDTRTTFTLSEELQLFDRRHGASRADHWFDKLARYLIEMGTIAQAPDPAAYLTDEFLHRVAADPTLKAFAEGELVGATDEHR